MVTADGMEKPESVLFHIKAPSSEEGTSALHSACLLREVGGGTGVRLVAAPHINVSSAARQPIRLRVAIPFDPQAYSRGYALRTVLPSFTHNVAISIYTGTTFSTFSLSSSDAPIRVSGVNTETLRLNTSHAPITLVQSAISGTAELTNHNGSILVGNATGLHNLEHQKTASRLIMRTTDAPLNATIHLVASPYHIPSFSLHARTSGPDAPLFFDVPSMSTTLMSTVALSANTDGAPATVELPPAFEGQFVVRGAVPAVFVRKDPEDPYGLRRTRKTTVSMVGENGMIATGSARWYPKHPLAGDVSVEDGFVNVTAVGSAASLNL
ncbi:hypothetical protein PUNSTDRAFT_122491 [Punctularia strigosozonata HHB-11173 SS5]|uniref:Uncharacterized protein n=1 Tax=Punctularia strigosozonata (strain HHB-11173) TaxID=741275 RepID=R7S5E6_PUNST|nr:uncharacterized protein PUNSTDRAFT_122491 [Punctularia strigosozonata HHB-11173 SS5]EIN05152.1 hypothetical protein PUNSTDRAFT_122491 [Punctularia strigosozonata HHB-11173 SS5]